MMDSVRTHLGSHPIHAPAPHKTRELLIRQRTMLINALRSHFA